MSDEPWICLPETRPCWHYRSSVPFFRPKPQCSVCRDLSRLYGPNGARQSALDEKLKDSLIPGMTVEDLYRI